MKMNKQGKNGSDDSDIDMKSDRDATNGASTKITKSGYL